MGPAEDLADGPGGGEGDAERAEEPGVEEADSEEGASPSTPLGGHDRGHFVGGLRGGLDDDVTVGVVVEDARGGNDDEGGDGTGEDGADEGVDFAHFDVADVHALVDDGGLLEEDLPGGDGGADVGHDEHDERGGGEDVAEVEAGTVETPANGGPAVGDVAGLHGPDGGGDVDEVEETEEERDLLEGPVAAGDDDDKHEGGDGEEGDPGRDVEERHGLGHADVFGDESEPVDEGKVADGEPAPDGPEGVEDGLGVATLGDGAETDGHLLHVVGHGDEEDEGPEESEAGLGAGLGVGGDAARVVVGNHGDDAGAEDGEQDESPSSEAAETVNALADPVHSARPAGSRRGSGGVAPGKKKKKMVRDCTRVREER